MSDPLLTRCVCIDPRRIDPATGHYPSCPDDIIPPDQLLPPWEVMHRSERVYEGRSARSAAHPEGKPIFGVVQTAELVPGKRWTAPVRMPVRASESVSEPVREQVNEPAAPSIVVVLDTETTGLRRQGHTVGVCEIGLAVIDLGPVPQQGGPRIIARHSKLLHPGMPIPRESSQVHGILDADVRDAPHLCDVWPALLAWIARFAGESPCVVAHNASFDREVIADVLRAHGIDLPPWQWRCSMQLARKVIPGLPSYSLHDGYGKTGLATSLQLVKGEGHRAMGDVITTVSLLGALRSKAGPWESWRGEGKVWTEERATDQPATQSTSTAPAEAPDTSPAPSAPATAAGARKGPRKASASAPSSKPVGKPAKAHPLDLFTFAATHRDRFGSETTS